ncbi:sugar phosphate nucleotidyltransferase [Heyndrickxia coagulans]|uniref:sugar phosphate nucleotidyltransferase n=1 Tax=Heyndrickxia coagulans TaxID=1398 RepID=UPI00077995B2|nr:sugar phosphate nucleotidyltransferase [Heyndrickxia coagulans]KYC63716.1 Mannose-1-phosphate guanylyltransferase (GDP) [Heyndrickxia coagulans]MED4313613.1 sugar phosphate nucleotidyltransferase [Heyndrickxia coagulans]UZH05024.1 sugar phosphate nucleotidyltransferase [Heyndrickxia coagulans]
MKIILLSGGSGIRLWPLSNKARSKQFLKVLKDKNNNQQSMVQRVWNQLKLNNLHRSTIIATSKEQEEIISNQLNNEAQIIVEPTQRDTFAAISLASSYLYSKQDVDINEIVVVLPVDPYVDDEFFSKIKELEGLITNYDCNMALMGVEPTYPSEKYGYIIPKEGNSNNSNILIVSHFAEKPKADTAMKFISEGALWNCGVFAFKLSYIVKLLEERNLPTNYNKLIENYHMFPKVSFDYEVVEKVQNIIALKYEGRWKDLGTWNTLTEEMDTNVIGKGLLSSDCSNTHLINELDIPATVLGVSNAIIAISPDGILISDKKQSPKIKELIKEHTNRPMYEERRWGWYRVLDYAKYSEYEVLTRKIEIEAGANLSYQFHKIRKEIWTIVKGEGIIALNGNLYSVKVGDTYQIEPGDRHSIKALTQLEIIEVQTGSEIIQEDVVRLYTAWSDIELSCTSKLKIYK